MGMTSNKTVLLTGCSRGIGFEIAKVCLYRNWNVIGTARKSAFPDELKASDLFTGLHADLSDAGELKDTLYPLISKHNPDVLINNAGIFKDADFEGEASLMKTG